MPRDEETVDRIFAGNLDGLPPLSSKVVRIFTRCHQCTECSASAMPAVHS